MKLRAWTISGERDLEADESGVASVAEEEERRRSHGGERNRHDLAKVVGYPCGEVEVIGCRRGSEMGLLIWI